MSYGSRGDRSECECVRLMRKDLRMHRLSYRFGDTWDLTDPDQMRSLDFDLIFLFSIALLPVRERLRVRVLVF